MSSKRILGPVFLGLLVYGLRQPPAAPAAPIPGYRPVAVWPAAAHGLPAPQAIAAGPDGRIWLLDGSQASPAQGRSLVALSAEGQKLETRSGPSDALDLAPEPGGDIYIGSAAKDNPRYHRTIGRYGPGGTPVWTQPDEGASGTGIGATAGRVFLTDPLKWTYKENKPSGGIRWRGRADGRVSGVMVPQGAANGFPSDVDVAPDGTLFATDLLGDAVFTWAPPYLPNDFVRWPLIETSGPWRVSVGAQEDGATLVAVLFSEGLVHVHRPDGQMVARFHVAGEPADLTMDRRGWLYFLDDADGSIRVFAPGQPPTPTPVPPDPPRGPQSCELRGSKDVQPALVDRCGKVQVTLKLDAVCPPGAVSGADVLLVIDTSNSMLSQGRMAGAKDAASRFLAGLDLRYHRLGVVTFYDRARLAQPLSQDRAQLEAVIRGLNAEGAGTNIHAGLRAAADHQQGAGRADALPVIILLSDGQPDYPFAPEPSTAALVAAERARARRSYVVTVGLGKNIDSQLLTGIASSPQDFYYAPDVVDLQRIYDNILKVVAAINVTDMILEDQPGAPRLSYLDGSSLPPALLVGRTLTWNRPALPEGGLVFSYTLRAQNPGNGPVGQTRLRYVDADGTRRSYSFPEPLLQVRLPAPTAGAQTATPGPGGPAPTATLPPPPATAASCPAGQQRTLILETWQDSVGVGGYRCPGCNAVFDSGDYPSRYSRPLRGQELPTLVVRGADGQVLWVGQPLLKAGSPPTAQVRLCVPPPYTVTLERLPAGMVSCPNSPLSRPVGTADLGDAGQALLRFPYWRGCRGLPTPEVLPSPTALAACPE